jgi:hypothetical protein
MTNDVAPGTAGRGKNPGELIPSPPGPKVLKIELRPDDGRPLRAFADVQLADGTIIRGFRVLEEPGKRVQVVCPQVSIKVPGRSPYFRTIITLPDALKGAVDFAILCTWKIALAGREEKGHATGLDKPTSENI